MTTRPQDPGARPARRYDNSRRAARARATERRILDAAAACFAESGYAATSIRAIADRASASPETVYAVFGSKSAVLRAWIDRAVVGDDGHVALVDHDQSESALRGPSRDDRGRAQAALVRSINRRVAVPLRVLAAAAQGDPELAAIADDYERRRRADIEVFVRALVTDPPSTQAVDPHLVDLLALWSSAEVYARLVLEGGWTDDEYEAEFHRLGTYLLERDAP